MMKRINLLILAIMATMTVSAWNEDRYVVMISLDGFRWDYPQWYDTPLMDRMAEDGVEAGLVPCFPSKTFPNHYSIATGLYPDHHGIIANSFLDRKTGETFSLSNGVTRDDPRFWKGEPIWLTAKRQGVKTAVYYWPGSDVKIQGEYPNIYHKYNVPQRLSFQERVDSILEIMQLPEDQRPHLIMGYMEEPDHNGHLYGPQAKETRMAVQQVDSMMSRLYNGIKKLPYAKNVDFIVVADHGMALVTSDRNIIVGNKIKMEWIDGVEGNMPANIYCKAGYADSVYNALKDVPHVRVWKKADMPKFLHYGTNEYCGDVIATPDLGYVLALDKPGHDGGMHGFDPGYNDMHALFRAVGPDFAHVKANHFPNIDVYPMVCYLLGIKPANCDGNLEGVKDILKIKK